VALTRAREGLVIGGWRSAARNPNDSDYMLLRKCLGDMDDVVTQDDGRLVLHHVGEMPPADDEGDVPPARKTETAIPQWLLRKAPAEPRLSRPIRPSEVGSDQLAPRPSAASASVNKARLIGQAAHRLFEILPAVSPDRRAAAARTVIGQYADLRQDEAERIINDVIKAMADPSLARLFAPDALAEVPINGVVEGVGGVAGQIDRLQIDHGSVLFADFKTGIRPEGDAPQSYQRQMALYAALLAQIYPGLEINGWLVWTESGKVDAFTMEKCESILELIRVNS
jgi:ATP-dependent helicase/nuclease subunit A